jgi:hypothetical protein
MNTTNNNEHSGGIMLDTPEQICAYRELLIYNGLKFEIRTARNGHPMRVSRGISCYAIAKRTYGLKGNRDKVLAALKTHLEAKYPGLILAADKDAK